MIRGLLPYDGGTFATKGLTLRVGGWEVSSACDYPGRNACLGPEPSEIVATAVAPAAWRCEKVLPVNELTRPLQPALRGKVV